jgi:hypothetical protein
MRSLQIDFRRKPPPSATGWLLLVAGIAAAGASFEVSHELTQQRAAQASRLARAQAAGKGANLAVNEQDDPAVVAARQLMERSKLPWSTLFSALESADPKDVALLAVNPEVQRRQVKIHAEARDLAAMLAYQRQLQQHPALSQVVLVDHTVMKDAPEKPVRFHILANWGGGHGNP